MARRSWVPASQRRIEVVLLALLAVFASARVAMQEGLAESDSWEAFLCRLGICSNDEQLQKAVDTLWSSSPDAADASIPGFREALRRDPASAYRWCDLGEAYQRAGRVDEARSCFEQAVLQGPHVPPILLRAGNFHLITGNASVGLDLMAHILDQVRSYDNLIFTTYDAMAPDIDAVLRDGIPDHPAAARAYFLHRLHHGSTEDVDVTWEWLKAGSRVSDELVGRYINFLLDKKRWEAAVTVLDDYRGEQGVSSPESEYVHNAGFEWEPLKAALDWQ